MLSSFRSTSWEPVSSEDSWLDIQNLKEYGDELQFILRQFAAIAHGCASAFHRGHKPRLLETRRVALRIELSASRRLRCKGAGAIQVLLSESSSSDTRVSLVSRKTRLDAHTELLVAPAHAVVWDGQARAIAC